MLARLTLSLRCTGKQIFDIIMWVSTDDNNSSVHIKKIPYSIIELCLAWYDFTADDFTADNFSYFSE